MRKCFLPFLLILLSVLSVPRFGWTVSRLYDRNTSDVIDADKDDAEWDNTNNAINTHTADTVVHGATGAVVGTTNTQTLTNKTLSAPTLTGSATINQAIVTSLSALTTGWTNNLGISLSGGTLTVTTASGAALSTTAIGWVGAPSATAGNVVALQVSAPFTVNDDAHASSDLTNMGFGITEASAWANDMPFFLYAANRNDTNITGADGDSTLFLARSPAMLTTPSASTAIGDTGAIPTGAEAQTNILILDDVTIANYTSLPCVLIGTIRMRWSSANTDWTIQSLGNSDGIGEDQLRKTFATSWTMPTGQNGAASGGMCRNNGFVAPIFTTQTELYTIDQTGMVSVQIWFTGDGGTAGTGGEFNPVIPYANFYANYLDVSIAMVSEQGSTLTRPHWVAVVASDNIIRLISISTTAYNEIQNSAFIAGGRSLRTHFIYKAF